MGRSSDDGRGGRASGASGSGRASDPGVDSHYPTPARGGSGRAGVARDLAAGAEDQGNTSDLAPGTILGKYQIVRRLGVGGMGSVYEAVHTGIAKAVALKT